MASTLDLAPAVTGGGKPAPAARIVVLGMPCRGTAAALQALVTAGSPPVAVVFADPGGAMAGLPLPSPVPGLPVHTVSRLDAAAAELIAGLAPEVLVTACFPWRVPVAIRALAPAGAFNIHPSLLPWGRGPHPIFWTFRRPEAVPGVSIHLLDDGFDTGPLIAQRRYPGPVEGRAGMLELDLMAIGAALLAVLLPDWLAGNVPAVEQAGEPVAAPRPAPADLVVSTREPAALVYRFAHGVCPDYGPLTVRDSQSSQVWRVADAIAWGASPAPAPGAARSGRLTLAFTGGWVSFARALSEDEAMERAAGSGGYPLALSSSFNAKANR